MHYSVLRLKPCFFITIFPLSFFPPRIGHSWCCLNRMLQEQEQEHVGFEDDEEDDPVFILTDEWREFFAKSEEKRKLGTSYFLSAFRLSEM